MLPIQQLPAKKNPAKCRSCLEVMIPTVLGLCLPWLITWTVLTRHRLSLSSETFREPEYCCSESRNLLCTSIRKESRSAWDTVAWNRSEGSVGLGGHVVTAQLLFQPLSGTEPVVAQRRLPGHPCSQQEKLYCCLQNALCSNGSLQLRFLLSETC